MVTVNYYVNPKKKRKDNTFNVKIIITYKRKRKMLPTSFYVTKLDLTRGGKIKNQQILDGINKITQTYKSKINTMGVEFGNITLEQIVKNLKEEKCDCDFFVYTDLISKEKKEKTKNNYIFVASVVEKYIGTKNLDMRLMDYSFFCDIEKFVTKRYNPGTVQIIMTYLKVIYKSAVIYFNNEHEQVLSTYVLTAYTYRNKYEPEKRAVDIDTIKNIYSLELSNKRVELARDLFILSFCLMGMNLVDMFNCEKCEHTIKYNRTKTKDSRSDSAYIEVEIDDRVKHIVDKYRGKNKMFCFSEVYKNYYPFKNAVSYGMSKLSLLVGKKLTFYSARHSFATIAYNDCGIDKFTVHKMLNHIDNGTKITDVYIKTDFKKINEANKKILDLLFN